MIVERRLTVSGRIPAIKQAAVVCLSLKFLRSQTVLEPVWEQ